MIIVIGATGFIGHYLVEQLFKDGFDLLATGRSRKGEEYYKRRGIPFVRMDISRKKDFEKLPQKGVSIVIHLASLIPAAASEHNAIQYMQINAFGTLYLLEYCRKIQVDRLIFTSSHFDVQGLWGSDIPIKPDAPRKIIYTGNHTLYIISKIAAMDYIEHYRQEYGVNSIIFRLCGVYGYGRYETGFELFVKKAMHSEAVEVWGDRSIDRDFIYVKDVVSALIAAIDNRNATGLYNLAFGEGISLERKIKTVVDAFSPHDNPSKLIYCPEKNNELSGYVYDIESTKKDIGFRPLYSFDKMVIDYKKERNDKRFDSGR